MSLNLAAFQEWILEALEFYRPRGYFKHLEDSNQLLATRVTPAIIPEGEATEDVDLAFPELDVSLLACDEHRALYDQLSFGNALTPKSKIYVAVMEALSKISRGAFRPRKITEEWDSPEGPIYVDFELNGQAKELRLEVLSGIFDFRILLQINRLLLETPYRFEMVPLDDMLFVTVLKAEEKSDMERIRGLSFMVLDLPRTFHPIHRFTKPHPPLGVQSKLTFLGTINEVLDRCVGRLELSVQGLEVLGKHRYDGRDHQESLEFKGQYHPSQGKFEGKITGEIVVNGAAKEYCGTWQGTLAPGNRVATGRWRGWFASDAEGAGEPVNKTLVYVGQWSAIEESLLMGDVHYLRRLRAWLGQVWEAKSAGDYPWILPLVDV